MRKTIALTVLLFALSATLNSMATDVGVPLYSSGTDKKLDVELYYEQYRRDIEMTGYSGTTFLGEQKENRIIGRFNFHSSSRATFYAEAGATDSDQSEGFVPLAGAGLKIKMHDSPKLNISVFASATYIPKIEYKDAGYVDSRSSLDYPDIVQTESYLEINGGFIISQFIQLDEKTTFSPYGGFMVSKLDGDEDYEFTYHVMPLTEKESGDMKDDGALSFFAGIGLTMDDRWGIRFEGRFGNQSSLSASILKLF